MVLLESNYSNYEKTFTRFKLKSTKGKWVHSDDVQSHQGLLVIFTCNHCPYAKALWNRLINDTNDIKQFGFGIIAINSNIHPDYPEDSFEKMKDLANSLNLPFDYLVDEDQMIAKKYDAQCTPDFFVLDNSYKLIYRGAYDNNWKDESQVTDKYLLNILKTKADNVYVRPQTETPSMGCSIKWQTKK